MTLLCIKCNILPVTAIQFGSEVLSRHCSICIKKLPDPDCEYCLGEGEFYWHSDDCANDDCALAGGYGDCEGQMGECSCSILDGIEI